VVSGVVRVVSDAKRLRYKVQETAACQTAHRHANHYHQSFLVKLLVTQWNNKCSAQARHAYDRDKEKTVGPSLSQNKVPMS